MDTTTVATMAVNAQETMSRQDISLAMTKQALQNQSETVTNLMDLALQQARAAAAEARGGVDIIA